MPAAWSAVLGELAPRLSAWRRHLHMWPELSFEEHETSRWIGERLAELAIPFTNPVGTSLVATIDGHGPGRTIALRADIDALPIEEANDVPYRSRRPGAMHACGHDGHTAILLGAGAALMAARDHFAGQVRLVFQAAEERPPGGALALIDAGALDGIDAVFGLHLTSSAPTGEARIRAGVSSASVDEFEVTIHGRGGHAGRPHEAVDAGLIAATCVVHLQTIVARRLAPLDGGVVHVGVLHAGTAPNVIAADARLAGTVRALTPAVRDRIEREVERVITGSAAALGGSAAITYRRGYPCLVNHPAETDLLRGAAAAVLGADRVTEHVPSLGGEDFARYLERWPGAFLRLGARDPARADTGPNHSPTFDVDEAALPLGARILVEAALSALSAPA